MPLVREAESSRFAQAQGAAATRVLALAADTRKAWVRAVAAKNRCATAGSRAAEPAEARAPHGWAGNFSKLQQLREQSFYADAALGLARAEQAARNPRAPDAARPGARRPRSACPSACPTCRPRADARHRAARDRRAADVQAAPGHRADRTQPRPDPRRVSSTCSSSAC
jgi:hypothetical protein